METPSGSLNSLWRRLRPALAALGLVGALASCSDDATSPPPAPTSGTILITIIPDTLAAPWELTGLADGPLAGAGPDILSEVPAGEYSLAWQPVPGWLAAEPATTEATLAAGDTLTFTGVYGEIPPPWARWATIPAGTFLMGAGPTEETALRNEKPRHQVTLTRPFLMQATEVTNAQYLELATWALGQGLATADEDGLWDNLDGSRLLLMDFSAQLAGELWCEIGFRNGGLVLRDVGHGWNPDHPVKMVTWYGAAAYCDWLSLREGLARAYDHGDWSCGGGVPYSARGYRLPTEAEWEHACRAGTDTPFSSGEITDPWGLDEPALDGVAWYLGNSVDWTHPVAQLAPNAFGLHDMHGNLFKWVDGFEYVYGADPETDPISPALSGHRVARGGAWTRPSHYHRAAFRRLRDTLDYRGPKQGFRPVRTLAE